MTAFSNRVFLTSALAALMLSFCTCQPQSQSSRHRESQTKDVSAKLHINNTNKMHNAKIVLLACGSFNPPTYMHLRMFEIARDHLHRFGMEVIGGIVSPVHDAYGKKELVAATHRLGMLRLALQSSDWIKVSDYETKQESWVRTRTALEHHQNEINAYIHASKYNQIDVNEKSLSWIPDYVKKGYTGPVQIKLLCGADLLESFATPNLWADEDIETIVGQHGIVVITREQSNPNAFIYSSDMLTKYMPNITIVTEWFKNDVSSTKIRRALKRSESVKYLICDKVIDYIHAHGLYGSKQIKYLLPLKSSVFLTPSPTEVIMESPTKTGSKCLSICNNNIFASETYEKLTIDTVDSMNKINTIKHPGQAVKIITDDSGEHTVVKQGAEASLVRPACLL